MNTQYNIIEQNIIEQNIIEQNIIHQVIDQDTIEQNIIENFLKSKNNGNFPFYVEKSIAIDAQNQIFYDEKDTVNYSIYKTKFMNHLIKIGQKYSICPLSNFRVSCIGQSNEDNISIGINMEFPTLMLNTSVHGEQFLMSTMLQNKEKSLKLFYVSHTPCGHCRQFIKEIYDTDNILIIITGINATYKYFELLPESFGPNDLGVDKTLFDYDSQFKKMQNMKIISADIGSIKIKPKNFIDYLSEESKLLFEMAQEQFYMSHSPYTKSNASVVVKTKDGKIGKGSYIESVAYNPSLSPLNCALISSFGRRKI